MPALKREKNTTVSIHQKEDFLTRMLKNRNQKEREPYGGGIYKK